MKTVLNIKVIIGAFTVAIVLLCGTLIFILLARPAAAPVPGLEPASAALTLLPAPTSTPRPLAPTATLIPPTPADTSTPAPGAIAVGAYVQITGTDGEGLRLRAAPGLNSELLFLGGDSEVFQVTDGPQEADGHVWWYLTAPYDAARSGWAAADYLTVIPSP